MATEKKENATATIELGNGKKFSFTVSREAYIEFINADLNENRYSAMYNFLSETVDNEQQEELAGIMKEHPQFTTECFGEVFQQYTPDTGLMIKKQKRTPKI